MASSNTASVKVQGMGATVHDEGVAFRVWAPHASHVSVIGSFNSWDENANAMDSEENGFWYANIPEAKAGDEYLFQITNGDLVLKRVDPQAREVTNSVGNGVISDRHFDWQGDDFQIKPLNELVIYEMHIGTFGKEANENIPAGFDQAIEELDYLERLGINCVEVMPVTEFAGDFSWGYNPAHIFAVESAYGGPDAFKGFVREAHQRGIAVVLDVVYNHFGPSDLNLWQFDGWTENELGGIYFYNDWRAETPWGQTRPDYGRGEVRQFIFDNAMMWLEEFHVDGLRYDMTLYMRCVKGDGSPENELPDGWSLARWVNEEIRHRYPGKITIAEDLQNNHELTRFDDDRGAGFHSQWDAQFVHPVRALLIAPDDAERDLHILESALKANYNGDPFQRVVYTESHDEVANGKARIPSEISPDASENWFAVKRSCLGAILVLTAPGVPMLFQGQEFLEDGWFRDTVPVDWDKAEDFCGIVRLYRDLIRARVNYHGHTAGLTGSNLATLHLDQSAHVMAYQRWNSADHVDDVVIVVNFSCEARTVTIRFPDQGDWKLILNSDAQIYNAHFGNTPAADLQLQSDQQATLTIGPYSALIYSKNAPA